MEVYVVTAKIQHMYDPTYYYEVIGVAESPKGAGILEQKAKKRGEVIDVDVELVEMIE